VAPSRCELLDLGLERCGRPQGGVADKRQLQDARTFAVDVLSCPSIGAASIDPVVRPVCCQGFPNPALPEGLQDENPRGILRLIDKERTRDAC
jgi:hypothetical protein